MAVELLPTPQFFSQIKLCLVIVANVISMSHWQAGAALLTISPHQWRDSFSSSFFFFRAASAAYGNSGGRGRIGTAAASPRHSNARSKPHLQPMPWCRILNPPSKARDWTCIEEPHFLIFHSMIFPDRESTLGSSSKLDHVCPTAIRPPTLLGKVLWDLLHPLDSWAISPSSL